MAGTATRAKKTTTAKKTTAKRATKPAQVVEQDEEVDASQAASAGPSALDLDTLERENSTEPFAFVHRGKRYLMSDPQEIDWKILLQALSNPVMFLRHTLAADDVVEFLNAPMPAWKMNILMERYRQHYGLPAPGEVDALPY